MTDTLEPQEVYEEAFTNPVQESGSISRHREHDREVQELLRQRAALFHKWHCKCSYCREREVFIEQAFAPRKDIKHESRG